MFESNGGNEIGMWTKSERVERPSAITGVGVWQVDPREGNLGYAVGHGQRVPEYIYLFLPDSSRNDTLVIAEAIRWDTASPKVLMVPYHADTDLYGFKHVHLYEVRLDKPIHVDSVFYLGGTYNNNHIEHWSYPAYPTRYCWLMPLTKTRKCNIPQDVRGFNLHDTSWNVVNPYAYSNWEMYGGYLPMIDYASVNVYPNDSAMGYCHPTGQMSLWTDQLIYAEPYPGYRFVQWQDSVTDNPRLLSITQDTTLIAFFVPDTAGDPDDTLGIGGVLPVPSSTLFTLTPNPARGEVTVRVAEPLTGILTVADASGREVLSREYKGEATPVTLDITALPSGVYFVTLRTEKYTATRKLVVEN